VVSKRLLGCACIFSRENNGILGGHRIGRVIKNGPAFHFWYRNVAISSAKSFDWFLPSIRTWATHSASVDFGHKSRMQIITTLVAIEKRNQHPYNPKKLCLRMWSSVSTIWRLRLLVLVLNNKRKRGLLIKFQVFLFYMAIKDIVVMGSGMKPVISTTKL